MKYYLLVWEDNWADEMDLDGHVVLTEEKYNDFVNKANEIKDSFTFRVGTNEEIEYYGGRLEASYNAIEISEKERKMLKTLGLLSMGFAKSLVDQVLEQEY